MHNYRKHLYVCIFDHFTCFVFEVRTLISRIAAREVLSSLTGVAVDRVTKPRMCDVLGSGRRVTNLPHTVRVTQFITVRQTIHVGVTVT